MLHPAPYHRYVIIQIKAVAGGAGVIWHDRALTAADGYRRLEARIAEELLDRGMRPLIALIDCTEGRVLAASAQWGDPDWLVKWGRRRANLAREDEVPRESDPPYVPPQPCEMGHGQSAPDTASEPPRPAHAAPSRSDDLLSSSRAADHECERNETGKADPANADMIEAPPRVVVGVAGGHSVVCIPEDYCEGLVALYTVQRARGTWGEFRRCAPEFYAEYVEPQYTDADCDVPGDDEPLDVLAIPGAGNGDWPWPAADMIQWLPRGLQQRFGIEVTTTLNGEYLYIAPEKVLLVIEALEAAGFQCRRNDEAVSTASGF